MLGLENVGAYMQSKQAQKLADWSEVVLDNEGRLVQEEMTRKFQVSHPTLISVLVPISPNKF
jgi:exportin-5